MKMYFGFILSIIFISLIVVGCDLHDERDLDDNTFGSEMVKTENNHQKFVKNQPIPSTDGYSSERDNLIRFFKLWNNPNKISYIYLISDNGQVLVQWTLKGKFSDLESLLSNPEQVVRAYSGNYQVVSSPSENGTYGSNGKGMFGFGTGGQFLASNCKYIWSDQPFTLSVKPLMVADIDLNKLK
jgi:hypothetical protein